MNSHVRVRVRGEQALPDHPGERPEPVQSEAAGRYRLVAGRHHFSFDETLEGTTAATRNHVIVGPDRVEVRKNGPVVTSMIFEKGKRHPMVYRTAFGQLSMEIQTKELTVEEDEEWMTVTLRYRIRSGSQTVSENVTVLEFSSEGSHSRQP